MRQLSRKVANRPVGGFRPALVAGAVVSASALGGTVVHGATVTFDPTATFNGYQNVSDLPQNGGGYQFGSSWGLPDLDSSITGSILTLSPNTSIDRDVPNDTYWWQDASGTSPGNKIMAASFYVENDALAGSDLTFTANVLANTLVSPYTSVAFINDFSPSYALVGTVTTPAVNGTFSITLPTTTAGDHIQYGFITTGPDARLAAEPTLGSVQVTGVSTSVPEPVSVGLLLMAVPTLIRRRRR